MTRSGIRILPERVATSWPAEAGCCRAIKALQPAKALDKQALHRESKLVTERSTADFVAIQLEYPRDGDDGSTLIAIHRHHAAFFDRQRQPAVLQRERGLAEQFAPPAMQRADVGIVVGGDPFEVVDGGDHLGSRRHGVPTSCAAAP